MFDAIVVLAVTLVALGLLIWLVWHVWHEYFRNAYPPRPNDRVPRWYTEPFQKQQPSNPNIPDHIQGMLPRGYVGPPEPELPPFIPANVGRKHVHVFAQLVSTSHDFPNLFTKRCSCGEERVCDLFDDSEQF